MLSDAPKDKVQIQIIDTTAVIKSYIIRWDVQMT